MIPALAATVAPAIILLAVAYPLRPQYGRLRTHPVPARQIIARLATERADRWIVMTHPPLWTVPR